MLYLNSVMNCMKVLDDNYVYLKAWLHREAIDMVNNGEMK